MLTDMTTWADKEKVIFTLCLYYCAITVGIHVSQNGPALLDLQLLTGTDTQQASAYLTGSSVGGMSGSLLMGVLYGRWNRQMMMSLALLGTAASVVALPWCSSFGSMIVMQILASLFRSSLFTAATVSVIRLWAPNSRVPLQIFHLSFSIGASIGPTFTQPFLAPKQIGNGTIVNSSTYFNGQGNGYLQDLTISDNASDFVALHESLPTSKLYLAFLISGTLFFIGSILFLILYFTLKTDLYPVASSSNYESLEKPLPRCQYLITVFLLFLCIFLSIAVQSPTVSFLPTFTVQYLDWSKADGANVSTVFWLSLAAGRFVFVFLTKYVSPFRYLIFSATLSTLAMVGNILFSLYGYNRGIWACTSLFGLSVSSQSPAFMMWTEESMFRLTSKVVSVFNLGISIPGMVLPPLLGFLMQNVDQMWVFYISLIFCVFLILMILFVSLWTRIIHDKIMSSVVLM